MHRIALILTLSVLSVSSAAADNFGSTFGSLATARTLGRGQTTLGGHVGVAEATSFVVSLTSGLSDRVDGRARAGFVDDDPFETELILASDLKWQVWNVGGQAAGPNRPPFDLALGPFLEWVRFDVQNPTILESFSVFQVGVQLIGSYPVHFESGGSLSPYGRLNVRHEALKANAAPGAPAGTAYSDSDLALGFNGGVAWRPRGSTMLLYGELQIDGNDGLFFGMEFPL